MLVSKNDTIKIDLHFTNGLHVKTGDYDDKCFTDLIDYLNSGYQILYILLMKIEIKL